MMIALAQVLQQHKEPNTGEVVESTLHHWKENQEITKPVQPISRLSPVIRKESNQFGENSQRLKNDTNCQ